MTLVAAVGLDTFPVIFGDLLVSGVGRAGPRRETAAAGDGGKTATPPPWSIPELEQKVVLLGDNCVIAWSGAAPRARAAVVELRSMALQAPLSIEIINAYLAKLDPAADDPISLVGWVKEADVFHQFWYRADVAQSGMFGRVSAGGSRAADFVKLAAQIAEGPASASGEVPHGLERAIASMLSATSLLLQSGLSGQSNPLRHLGDGFEIATFAGDKFAKVGDVAFVWWKADVDGGEVRLSGPECIFKHDYSGESLLLHALRMRPGNVPGDSPVLEEAKRIVAPFGGADDVDHAADVSWPGLAATFTCHVVLVRTPKELAVVNQIEYSRSKTPRSIRFALGDGQIPFGLNQQFCDELTRGIHARFSGR